MTSISLQDYQLVKTVAFKIAKYVAEGDLDALRALYSPDARIWHNVDDVEKSVDEALVFLSQVLRVTASRRYENIRLTPTANGYVDQHYLAVVLADGQQARVPICVVVTLEGEKIKRLEEYIESGAGAPIDAALKQGQ